ncbi:MAG: glycosyltransferase family 4 protein [Verrucomicrobiota bacterium]
MPPSHPTRAAYAFISSGLGRVKRGVEIWMLELASHWAVSSEIELWSGGPPPDAPCARVRLHACHRDAAVLRGASWDRRYLIEQLSILPATLLNLKKRQIALAYCGDPALAWHLKKFKRWHGARVVFMNGMRLSPNWCFHFDGVHLLTPVYLDEARAALPGKDLDHFFVAPHFVDVQRFKPATPETRVALRHRFNLSESEFVVLNVGPVGTTSHKRLDFLIETVARMNDESRLLSVGAEEEGAEEIKALASRRLGNRMKFLGPVDRAEMPSVYQLADAYGLAALEEPFSIALLEALASGLPIVHHQDKVKTWLLVNASLPVSMENLEEATRALSELKARPALRKELSARARELAMARYAPARICAEIRNAFQKIRALQTL